jgi:hypothetical protein
MKKLFITGLLFASIFGFGQNNTQPKTGKNEYKINAFLLVFGAFDVGYERVLNEESAIGVSLFVPIIDDIQTKFMLTSYYRYYFGQKPATGFYLEGFGSINNIDDEIYVHTPNTDPAFYDYQYKRINVTDFAFGIGLGGKWISKKGVTFEINTGFGRNLFSEYNKYDRDYEFIGRGGISVGYRF